MSNDNDFSFQLPSYDSMAGYGTTAPLPQFDFSNGGYGNGFLQSGMGQNFSQAAPNVVNPAASGWGMGDIFKGAVGTPGAPGWGGMALGAASGIANTFLGMKQYGLAKKSLAQNKEQFQMNFGAQQKMTNSRLEDRQAARVASGRGYESVSDYMKKYAV